MKLKDQIIELRKQGFLYPEIVSALGCSYDYVKDISRENDLGYSKDELAKRSGNFKPYKDWQRTVDDYYGGPGIAEVIEQHRSSNGEMEITVRCLKCGDVKKLSSCTLRHKNLQGRCLKCQMNQTQKKKVSERFEREWREEYQCHSNGRQMKIRLCECGAVIPLDKHGGVTLCDDCRTQHELAQKRKDNKKHDIKRRHELKGGDWTINLEELFERDHGLCYLCNRECDWSDYEIRDGAFIAGNNYPSIDHVVPLAKGGQHKWENVRLACRLCNSLKRDLMPHTPQ